MLLHGRTVWCDCAAQLYGVAQWVAYPPVAAQLIAVARLIVSVVNRSFDPSPYLCLTHSCLRLRGRRYPYPYPIARFLRAI